MTDTITTELPLRGKSLPESKLVATSSPLLLTLDDGNRFIIIIIP